MQTITFADLSPSPDLRFELDSAYRRVMASGRYILGPEVEAFEREFALSIGASGCVGVGSGFDALAMAMLALGVSPGDEVLLPANAPLPVPMAVSSIGACPRFVDPDWSTGNLDVNTIPVTGRARALIVVHLYGQPANMPLLREFATDLRLALIEDCSQAHGARIGRWSVGAWGDASAWSFYPTKNMGGYGDGGAITVRENSPVLDKVRQMRFYGAGEMYGRNSRLDELQAAFLRVRLGCLGVDIARRRILADIYQSGLTGTPGIVLPEIINGCSPAWHQYVIRVSQRDRLRQRLASANIETLIHYPLPPYRMAVYGGQVGEFPITDDLCDTVLSLPVASATPAEAQETVRVIREAVQ